MKPLHRLVSSPRGRRRRFAPRIDSLETRALLSTLVVMNTDDSGPGSLRQAIADSSNGDTITFAHSLRGQTITLASPAARSTSPRASTSRDPAPSQLAVSGGGGTEVFDVSSGTKVTISGLTITGGSATQGGGISNAGNLTLDNDAVTGNQVGGSYYPAPSGGGIYNTGALTIDNSGITNNQALGVDGGPSGGGGSAIGGGIYSSGGSVTLKNSTMTGNSAVGGSGGFDGDPGYGGAIYNDASTLTILEQHDQRQLGDRRLHDIDRRQRRVRRWRRHLQPGGSVGDPHRHHVQRRCGRRRIGRLGGRRRRAAQSRARWRS